MTQRTHHCTCPRCQNFSLYSCSCPSCSSSPLYTTKTSTNYNNSCTCHFCQPTQNPSYDTHPAHQANILFPHPNCQYNNQSSFSNEHPHPCQHEHPIQDQDPYRYGTHQYRHRYPGSIYRNTTPFSREEVEAEAEARPGIERERERVGPRSRYPSPRRRGREIPRSRDSDLLRDRDSPRHGDPGRSGQGQRDIPRPSRTGWFVHGFVFPLRMGRSRNGCGDDVYGSETGYGRRRRGRRGGKGEEVGRAERGRGRGRRRRGSWWRVWGL
ncbi:hypothetical protein BKA61DRAFT_24090 [Leptodontidium sp. MPI-SDFR-AT-0119]|nr:hypothetical protein BKA61DRAFT_24090 [Leptodontidium sp. MPI-SDFR-AT-0119]